MSVDLRESVMLRTLVAIFFTFSFLALPQIAAAAKDECSGPDSDLGKIIRGTLSTKIKISKICQSPLEGIYEVVINDNRMIYVHPKTQTIIVGTFIRKGVNLTKVKMDKLGLLAAADKYRLSADEKKALSEKVVSAKGMIIPVKWGDLGKQMIDTGVIDQKKFENLYSQRGGMNDESKKLLYGTENGELKLTLDNSRFVMNLLWALALGNDNVILKKGPMMRTGGASSYASTGGWTLSTGKSMTHYAKHPFIKLTRKQQKLVEEVSKNIYRPCCNNSTYFPDCNHGMAMLGLLQLLASQGSSEKEMYQIALKVNTYWFPGTYLTIAKYLKGQGVEWKDVNAKEILGAKYSSMSGYRQVLAKTRPLQLRGSGGCGV